jgi:hypothetical protein
VASVAVATYLRRIMLVMQVKIPAAKTTITPNFCFCGRCRRDKTGIGIIRITKSVTMFNDALKNQRNSLDMQFPWIVESQKALTGIQLRMALRTHQSP